MQIIRKALAEREALICRCGSGAKGHIGINQPGTPFEVRHGFTMIRILKRGDENPVPATHVGALRAGIKNIMHTRKLILM